MHLEKELKVLGVYTETAKLTDKLIKLGAEVVFDGFVHEVAFSHPKINTHGYGKVLRLRQYVSASFSRPPELTLKKRAKVPRGSLLSGGCKVRKEYEFTVSDFDAALEFLKTLGFRPDVYDREKIRTEWKLPDGVKVCIDKYPRTTPYCEIEGPNYGRIKAAVRLLGLDGRQTSRLSSSDLLKKWGVNWKCLKFDSVGH